jgi:hypothetical protein
MRQIVAARLALRPITAEEVLAVLNGQRRSDWAGDFPAEGDQVIARLLVRTGMPADDARRFGHRLVVERDTSTVVGGVGFFGPPQGGEVEIGYGIVPSRQRQIDPSSAPGLISQVTGEPRPGRRSRRLAPSDRRACLILLARPWSATSRSRLGRSGRGSGTGRSP